MNRLALFLVWISIMAVSGNLLTAGSKIEPSGAILDHDLPAPEVRFVTKFSSTVNGSQRIITGFGPIPVPNSTDTNRYKTIKVSTADGTTKATISPNILPPSSYNQDIEVTYTGVYNEGHYLFWQITTAFGYWDWQWPGIFAAATYATSTKLVVGGGTWEFSEPMAPITVTEKISGPGSTTWEEATPVAFNYSNGGSTSQRGCEYKAVTSPTLQGTKVFWFEVFSPADGSDKQYSPKEWTVNGKESPVFTLKAPTGGYATVEMLSSLGEIAVDANRDGMIKLSSEDATDATSAEKPYRFWINDDDDKGNTEGTDISMGVDKSGSGPMGPANWQGDGVKFKVYGTRDLVDLFPVFLDIKQLLIALPPSANIIYKLKHEEGAVNFVYTGLKCTDATKYQTQHWDEIFGPDLNQDVGQADKQWVTASGINLFPDAAVAESTKFLDAIQNHDGGVILVEGRKVTDKPLVLCVEKNDGTVIAEIKLELKLSPVEQMFRHLNLRNGPGAPSGLIGGTSDGHTAIATNLNEPSDAFPDEPGDPKWLLFVHGFNVSGQKARGWNSETFKRLYWSGLKARFVGVAWFGNPSPAEPLNIVQGYQWAVRNAVPTAHALAQKANSLPGSKVIMGHSQGCWVASVAVADGDMIVNKALLVDAAFARECFDGEPATDHINMVPSEWVDYPTWSWASNWYQRFEVNDRPSSDNRSTLKWYNRLACMLTRTVVHSFYSSTEDVLGKFPGTPTQAVLENAFKAVGSGPAEFGRNAWVCNEKTKGNKAFFTQGSGYFGWGFNLNDGLLSSYPKWYVPLPSQNARRVQTPSEIAEKSTPDLLVGIKFNPLFKSGWGKFDPFHPAFEVVDTSTVAGPGWIEDLFYDSLGSATAGTNQTQLLAEGIPALSLPVGSNLTTAIGDRNHDMPALYASEDWPRGNKGGTEIADWHHSDMREVAYVYMSKFFKEIVDETN